MARVYAGFHYRFSATVGSEMGQKIGTYAANAILRPTQLATSR
jgi:hypothetical protein